MSTRPIIICGLTFQAPVKFSPGHICSANEAAALNTLLFNSVTKKLRPLVEKNETSFEELEGKFLSMIEEFDFTKLPKAGIDPVRKEAMKIGRATLERALLKNNLKIEEVSEEQLEKLYDQLFAKKPEFLAEARRRVLAIHAVAQDALD